MGWITGYTHRSVRDLLLIPSSAYALIGDDLWHHALPCWHPIFVRAFLPPIERPHFVLESLDQWIYCPLR